MLSRFVVQDFFPYLNYYRHNGDILTVNATTPLGANDPVLVKLCTNDYGNYFTSQNFIMIAALLLVRYCVVVLKRVSVVENRFRKKAAVMLNQQTFAYFCR